MKLHNRMERVLPRVIEVEPAAKDLHYLRLGCIGNLPNEPVLQLDFQIVEGATDWIGETFQRNLQGTRDGKATIIALKDKLDRHELRRIPRCNCPAKNG